MHAVTIWRAHMMLMTVLCILAVDFQVFPRALAKCESFGVSIVRYCCWLARDTCADYNFQMDLGVGSFIFSQGFVSAIPLLKNPASVRAPAIPKLLFILRKTAPLIALGLMRVVMVKGTDYPVSSL
jgi:phosphatidylinositol glycan class W